MFCCHCGAQIHDEAVFCVHCGCSVKPLTPAPAPVPVQQPKDDTMSIIIKIFMVVGCISMGWALLPLAWCIPMTVSVFKSIDSGKPISTGMKVCSLLFVNTIAGICMLCANDI